MSRMAISLSVGAVTALLGGALLLLLARLRRSEESAARGPAGGPLPAGFELDSLRAALIDDLTELLAQYNLQLLLGSQATSFGVRNLSEPGSRNEWATIVDHALSRGQLPAYVGQWTRYFPQRPDVAARAEQLQRASDQPLSPAPIRGIGPGPFAGLAVFALLAGGLAHLLAGRAESSADPALQPVVSPEPALSGGPARSASPAASGKAATAAAPASKPVDCLLEPPESWSLAGEENTKITADTWTCKAPLGDGRFQVDVEGNVAFCWTPDGAAPCPALKETDLLEQKDRTDRSMTRSANLTLGVEYTVSVGDAVHKHWTPLTPCRRVSTTEPVSLGEPHVYVDLDRYCHKRGVIDIPPGGTAKLRIVDPNCAFGGRPSVCRSPTNPTHATPLRIRLVREGTKSP